MILNNYKNFPICKCSDIAGKWKPYEHNNEFFFILQCNTCNNMVYRSPFFENEISIESSEEELLYGKMLTEIATKWKDFDITVRKRHLTNFMKHCTQQLGMKSEIDLSIEKIEEKENFICLGFYKNKKITLNKNYTNDFLQNLKTVVHEITHAKQEEFIEGFLEANRQSPEPLAGLWASEMMDVNKDNYKNNYKNLTVEHIARLVADAKIKRLHLRIVL